MTIPRFIRKAQKLIRQKIVGKCTLEANSEVQSIIDTKASLFVRLLILLAHLLVAALNCMQLVPLKGRGKPDTRLFAGDLVYISHSILPSLNDNGNNEPGVTSTARKASTARVEKDAAPLDVLLENDNILIVNKPSGVVVHGGSTPSYPLSIHVPLNEAVTKYLSKISNENLNHQGEPVIFPLHRLDKDTSGCVAYAKNRRTAAALSDAFANRGPEKIRKAYVACLDVSGLSSGAFNAGDEGLIDMPLKKGKHVPSPCVDQKPKRYFERVEPFLDNPNNDRQINTNEIQIAKTHFKFLHVCWRTFVAWVCFQPLTGRTHQLRAHAFHALGAPIVGDLKYALPPRRENTLRGKCDVGSSASFLQLHAIRLRLCANGRFNYFFMVSFYVDMYLYN